MEEQNYKSYRVWDVPTRLFHWINVLCILGLIAAGTVILWAGALGLSTEGKILMKTVHVYVGYVFAINLLIRLMWAFAGNSYARWAQILPLGSAYRTKLKAYLVAKKAGGTPLYLGHNPVGQLAVAALFLLLILMAVSGVMLAGTDVYLPPFGALIQDWVAAPGVNPADVIPYDKSNVDAAAFAEMRDFRTPFILTHYWTFFGILGLVVLHIAAVVYTDIKTGSGLISAMFTGKKILPGAPQDKGASED